MMFSVLIPVYNAERFLQEALDSVSKQTFGDYEIVIDNDGSTDGSLDIIRRFEKMHDKVTVLSGSNRGLLIARRRLINHAKGKYIVFLDADDALRPDALERCEEEIRKSNADIVAFRLSRRMDYSLKVIGNDISKGKYEGSRYELIKQHVCRGRYNSLCGKAIRLECIDRDTSYGKYEGLMHGEDLFQLLPIVDFAKSLVQLDDALYFYRPSEESSTSCYRPTQLGDIVKVSHRLIEYANRWGGACLRAAAVGEAKQYINLLKMSEKSRVPREEKDDNYQAIRATMVEEGVFERCLAAPQRIDDCILLTLIQHNQKHLSRWVIKVIEAVKCVAQNHPAKR